MKVSKAEADYSFGVDVLVVVRPESCYRLEWVRKSEKECVCVSWVWVWVECDEMEKCVSYLFCLSLVLYLSFDRWDQNFSSQSRTHQAIQSKASGPAAADRLRTLVDSAAGLQARPKKKGGGEAFGRPPPDDFFNNFFNFFFFTRWISEAISILRNTLQAYTPVLCGLLSLIQTTFQHAAVGILKLGFPPLRSPEISNLIPECQSMAITARDLIKDQSFKLVQHFGTGIGRSCCTTCTALSRVE